VAVIEKSVDKDDLLTRLRIREIALFGLIGLTAVLANLPAGYARGLGLDPQLLVAVLACAAIVGLFLYLKFFFFLAVVLLILGANMPDQVAESFGISRLPLILALLTMIGISLINHVIGLLPTGLEPRPKERSPEAIRALFYAINRNNVAYAQKVLQMNVDPNLQHESGYTPLAYAAMKGNPLMVGALLAGGADASLTTREGDTAVELALRAGHAEVADLLKRARQEGGETALAAGARQGDNTVYKSS